METHLNLVAACLGSNFQLAQSHNLKKKKEIPFVASNFHA